MTPYWFTPNVAGFALLAYALGALTFAAGATFGYRCARRPAARRAARRVAFRVVLRKAAVPGADLPAPGDMR